MSLPVVHCSWPLEFVPSIGITCRRISNVFVLKICRSNIFFWTVRLSSSSVMIQACEVISSINISQALANTTTVFWTIILTSFSPFIILLIGASGRLCFFWSVGVISCIWLDQDCLYVRYWPNQMQDWLQQTSRTTDSRLLLLRGSWKQIMVLGWLSKKLEPYLLRLARCLSLIWLHKPGLSQKRTKEELFRKKISLNQFLKQSFFYLIIWYISFKFLISTCGNNAK